MMRTAAVEPTVEQLILLLASKCQTLVVAGYWRNGNQMVECKTVKADDDLTRRELDTIAEDVLDTAAISDDVVFGATAGNE